MKRRKFIISTSLASCSVSVASHFLMARQTAKVRSAMFLGDSLTAGDGVDKEYTFSALVGQKIEGLSTVNQGRSGWATSSYLRRWDEVAAKLPEQVDIIYIQLGANDLRVDGHPDAGNERL